MLLSMLWIVCIRTFVCVKSDKYCLNPHRHCLNSEDALSEFAFTHRTSRAENTTSRAEHRTSRAGHRTYVSASGRCIV
jgi:hypothetical protein